LNKSIAVPVHLFVDAQQKGYNNQLKFFIATKILFPIGKSKLDNNELQLIEKAINLKSRKTSKSNLKFLIEKGWIIYNNTTKYYIFKSFNKINIENEFQSKLFFPIQLNYINNFKAITGAVIYGYLYLDFKRKLKKKGSVLINGDTYNSKSFKYIVFAPVSVLSIKKIFNISPATASRLKIAAMEQGFIEVKKNFTISPINNGIFKVLKYNDKSNRVFYKDGKFQYQEIDTIKIDFIFLKRKKLKTYING
jgi:hypothetical protein